jgi:hypothetical protein
MAVSFVSSTPCPVSLNTKKMTTPDDNHDEETSVRKEWIITPPSDEPAAIEFYESLIDLLQPYEPADTEAESDKQFTTAEIVQAIEIHYNIPQGDAKALGIDKEKLVDYLKALGYKSVNTGGLTLQWVMKKRRVSA